jgi:hypothetical protein
MSKKPKQCLSELMPGALLMGQDGSIRDRATLDDKPTGAMIVVTRYLVGVNVIMDHGAHAFCPLTPYLYSFVAAMNACEELREDYPNCAVVWTNTAVDPASAAQMAELAEMRSTRDEEISTSRMQ